MEDRQLSEKGFNATIFECIDRAISTLGDDAKQALYHRMTSVYGLEPKQLRSRPLDVAEYLHEILGDVGYSFFEKLIIKEIKTVFNFSLRDGVSFGEVVAEARRKFLSD